MPEHDQTQPVAVPKSHPKSLMPQLYFGTLYMILYVGFLYFIFGSDVALTPTQQQIANIIVGQLGIGLALIMGFLFGSSAGSKAKTDKLG